MYVIAILIIVIIDVSSVYNPVEFTISYDF
jgi:hypothetical protein